MTSLLLTACGSERESFSVLPPAVEIPSPAGNHSAAPNLVTNAAGDLLLSWTETAGENGTMYFTTLKGGAWLPKVKIAAGSDWFVNCADVPEIAGDGAGNLIANFLLKSGSRSFGYDVNLVLSGDSGQARSDPMVPHDDHGRTFGKPVRVDAGRPVGKLDVVLLDAGTAMVSWLESQQKREQLNVRKVFKQGQSEGPQVVSKIAQSSGFPQLSNAHGKVYLAWADGDRLRTAVLQPRINLNRRDV